MKRMFLLSAAASFACACLTLTCSVNAEAGGKSDTKVKATASATAPGKDSKQSVTITLDIEKGWYIYANPVGWKGQEDNHTVVTFAAKEKVTAAVKYPEGVVKTTTENKKTVQYRAYVGRVVLQAELQRAVGDNSPLQVSIDVNACSENICLFPGVVKLTVPSGK